MGGGKARGESRTGSKTGRQKSRFRVPGRAWRFSGGCYVRNPPQSRHTPGSKLGCTIFVKLWQFDPADRTHMRIDTNKMALLEVKEREGVELMPLFKDAREDVRIERWATTP
jgi:hypothetical protein